MINSLIAANYARGRHSAYGLDLIVIHVTEGSAADVIDFFHEPRPNDPTSAHYMVQKDGQVVRFVDEADTAYHAGRVDHPTAQLVVERVGANPNGYSIGIEHEGDGHHELTDAQRAASVALIHDICTRHSIPIDRVHIVGHHEIFSLKECPGAIDVDRLVADVVSSDA